MRACHLLLKTNGWEIKNQMFYEAYENASSRNIDHEAINFWEIMAHIRWAIIARQQGERFATSGENSLEPAMTAFIAPQLEWEVMRMTEDWGK